MPIFINSLVVAGHLFTSYYHLWFMEIPHLSFLAVPVTERDDDDHETRSNTTTDGSLSATRSKAGTKGKRRKSGDDSMMSAPTATPVVSKQQEKKLKVTKDHMKTMEDIERERLSRRTKRDKLANHLSLTAELKTIEEM